MYFTRQALATVNRAACVTLTMYCLTAINQLVKRKVLTMAEYIKREAAKRAVDEAVELSASEYDMICDYLDRIPAADVALVVHGRWIHSRYENCSEQFELVKCSQCNHEAYAMAFYVRNGNYCPNCGARMDGDSDALD